MRLYLDNALGKLAEGYTDAELEEAGIGLKAGTIGTEEVVKYTLRMVVSYVSRKAVPNKREDVLCAALLGHVGAIERWKVKEYGCLFVAYLRTNLRWSVYKANLDRQVSISVSWAWKTGHHEWVREIEEGDIAVGWKVGLGVDVADTLEVYLSEHERRIVRLLLMGYTRKEVAERLGMPYTTLGKKIGVIGEKVREGLLGEGYVR
jgi:hypothetical protein